MSIIARFRAIADKDKVAVVRKLLESSTPNFDFFYFVVLSVVMATLGLMLNSSSIVIGSMLIAPLLYPILSLALGLVMSNTNVMMRSIATLSKSLFFALGASILTVLLFGDGVITQEIVARTIPGLGHFAVAVCAGAAVAYALAQPEWSETLPGIAISVALIPPLAAVGVGIAYFDIDVATGASVMFLMNLAGIVFSAMISFSLMNLYTKQNIAKSTIKKEDKKLQKEEKEIEKVKSEMLAETEDLINKK